MAAEKIEVCLTQSRNCFPKFLVSSKKLIRKPHGHLSVFILNSDRILVNKLEHLTLFLVVCVLFRMKHVLQWIQCFILYAIGLYLFSSGFLLSRKPLENVSDFKFTHLSENRTFDKVVLVVVDALRYDFIERTGNSGNIIFEVLDDGVSSVTRLHLRSDPPTTTMQRIKSMVTGSLPSFVEAGSNFATTSMAEDNLLHQYVNRFPSSRIHFMGDDTWTYLFPDILNDTCCVFPYESFKLFDLNTVDNGIKTHMFPLLESRNYDVLIAHFLGVDHCGHKYGPDHPSMDEKLAEINDVLKRILLFSQEDSLLIVIGDHGM
jgi:phosphatidylinositol glycan class O